MTRATWNEIANALARLRSELYAHAEASRTQRRAHLERAKGVELAARTVCAAVRRRSKRFDSRRFMRIVMGSK